MDANELKHFAQRGEVPAQKRGDEFIFEHRLLDEWAQRRIVDLPAKQLTGEHAQARADRRKVHGEDFRVASLLPPNAIAPALSAKAKGGVLRDMTDLADATGLVYDPENMFRELVAREEAASTAVGGGGAFLHARFHDPYLYAESFLALGRTQRPIFFGAEDGTGTDLFFLICCTDHALHLHVLARLCLLAHGTSLLENLRVAPDADAMRAALESAEEEFLAR